jgi:hypothetical protein
MKSSFERAFPDCEIVDATEDAELKFLGNSRAVRRAVKAKKLPGAVKVIRQYPDGSEAEMGYAQVMGMKGQPKGPIYMTGPTKEFTDRRNVAPDGTIAVTAENAARFHGGGGHS